MGPPVETDRRVPGFLGRVLDGSAQPAGTCFQVTPGVLVTAWHVLDDLGAGDVDAVVEVDPLQGGVPRQAQVRRVDPVHDLAVLSTAEPLASCVTGLATTDEVELDTRSRSPGCPTWRIRVATELARRIVEHESARLVVLVSGGTEGGELSVDQVLGALATAVRRRLGDVVPDEMMAALHDAAQVDLGLARAARGAAPAGAR
jgi:hypothetical protein